MRTALLVACLCLATPASAQFRALAVPITYSQNYDPSLSPDGKRMVFLKALEGRETLFIANSDGTAEKQLLHTNADIEDPAWSPDGRLIAYVWIEGSKKSLHVIGIDGSGDRRVTPPNQSPIHPAWTPDSKGLLYCTDDDLDPPRKNAAGDLPARPRQRPNFDCAERRRQHLPGVIPRRAAHRLPQVPRQQ